MSFDPSNKTFTPKENILFSWNRKNLKYICNIIEITKINIMSKESQNKLIIIRSSIAFIWILGICYLNLMEMEEYESYRHLWRIVVSYVYIYCSVKLWTNIYYKMSKIRPQFLILSACITTITFVALSRVHSQLYFLFQYIISILFLFLADLLIIGILTILLYTLLEGLKPYKNYSMKRNPEKHSVSSIEIHKIESLPRSKSEILESIKLEDDEIASELNQEEGKGKIPSSRTKFRIGEDMWNFGIRECPICFLSFNRYSKIGQLKCHKNHVFHMSCIQAWTHKTSSCPICRTIIRFPIVSP